MLTNLIVKNALAKATSYKIGDSRGMYLHIHPNNGKYWRLKYRYAGKQKTLALGTYPDVSLEDARERRDKARKQLVNGIDPGIAKKESKLQVMQSMDNTFEYIAREWHSRNLSAWGETHGNALLKSLERDIFPQVGYMPIESLTAPVLLKTLKMLEDRGAITIAHRMLRICGQILRYAIITGRAKRDSSADLKGVLKTKKIKHYANLSEKQISDFLHDLEEYKGETRTKLALQLLILTFVRTNELRNAEWKEIDWIKQEWRIPGERMKMETPHIVPLSKQALAILRHIQTISGNTEHLFPNQRNPNKSMSNNTLLHAIYRMGYKSETTVHGFRGTASTILNENGFHADIIEKQLSHSERNKVRAAYNHAEYLVDRRKMMQWWADFIDQKGGTNVILLRRA